MYDLAFTQNLSQKPTANISKHVKVGGIEHGKALLNFLEHGTDIQIEETGEPAFDLSKVKINKQFTLVNYLPKLKSVPATPQFFDMAGGYITYPDAELEAKKYEIQGGMFSAISGFFG